MSSRWTVDPLAEPAPSRSGSWWTVMITATPTMNPVMIGTESKSAIQPSRSKPDRKHDRTGNESGERRESDRLRRSGDRQMGDRRGEQRRDRRVGADRDDPARPEEEEGDRCGDERPQRCRGRHSREARGGELLRHRDHEKREPRDQVGAISKRVGSRASTVARGNRIRTTIGSGRLCAPDGNGRGDEPGTAGRPLLLSAPCHAEVGHAASI